ncbi:hypothetical protein A2950_00930 [Candidatus Kaiserbacteria bacterium RIFCSPLOWO2_01_FULL_55_19]|uniref:DUF5652 domain-containing protein n=1 Tax=Candidatus Kaiserbacteria bacterium RIFCSPLOWO2_01_FULL_55_19 TaxID=1798516 RepID=A0A1F6ES07_9BACT|nr:MAG: hypothetical protein A2950_00930 [Candidatus Kaiserbacteria bacterium RIFCSPLOWO2_01_FULL_55_19]
MQPFTPLYSPFASEFMTALIPLVIVLVLWTVILKGYALWSAARNTQKWWFIALLVINTLGILELIYLIWFRKTPSHAPAPAVSSSTQA